MQIKLYKLDRTLRHFLAAFISLLMIATLLGLAFVYQTTQFNQSGVVERYNGSSVELDDEMDVPESYPKSVIEMVLNTHNHLFGFSFIFLSLGMLFYFNSILSGFWKYILMVEPFLSVLLTFSSIWAVRFIHPDFVYVTLISAFFTYGSLFVMGTILLYELLFKKEIA
jgi:hypothetical protein